MKKEGFLWVVSKNKEEEESYGQRNQSVAIREDMKSSVSEVNHALEDLVTLSNGLKENFVVALKAAGALDLERKKRKEK